MTNDITPLAADAALCLWEACVSADAQRNDPAFNDVRAYREAWGTLATRTACLRLGQACSNDWLNIADDEPIKGEAFDWEFCPWWLTHCVDWGTAILDGVYPKPWPWLDRREIIDGHVARKREAEARRIAATMPVPTTPATTWVLVSGSPVQGFTIWGPFVCGEDAVSYAEDDIESTWWATEITKPLRSEGDA